MMNFSKADQAAIKAAHAKIDADCEQFASIFIRANQNRARLGVQNVHVNGTGKRTLGAKLRYKATVPATLFNKDRRAMYVGVAKSA
jgi:hypothetical protein